MNAAKMRDKPIPKKKIKAVDELAELAQKKKTILIASTKNLPDSQFQDIRKKLRGKAIIKVPKKNIIFRAIDKIEKGAIKKLKEQVKADIALMFSDLDAFELAAELVKNKVPAGAKAGQLAPTDIEIEAGPTDLVPGPAISELGSLGIQIQIEEGKIHIRQPKVIVKQGGKISEAAAGIMNKLDIKPFSVGFLPLAAFDTQEEKLYLDIKVDAESTKEELRQAYNRALPFAVSIGYVSDETIKFIISKAGGHEKVLGKFSREEINSAADTAIDRNDNKKTDEGEAKNSGEKEKNNVDESAQENKDINKDEKPSAQAEANTQKEKTKSEEAKE